MPNRLNYAELNPRAVNGFAGLGKHLSAVTPQLRALIELRVSQINGCVYCLDLHSRELREMGEDQQRLDCLAAWREYPHFTPREKAALAWAEAITHVSETNAPDELYERLFDYFSEAEIADLTLIVAFMNTWNRLAVGFREMPAPSPALVAA